MTPSCDYAVPSLLPTLECTLHFIQHEWTRQLAPRLLVTFLEALVGLVIAMIAAFLGAGVASASRAARGIIDAAALASQIIPPVLAVPLLLYLPLGPTWGIYLPRVALAAAFAAYPAYQIVSSRLRMVDDATCELFAVFPLKQHRRWLDVRLPLTKPDIFTSLQIATPLSLAGAIVGEWATGAGANDRGLASSFIVAARNLYPNQAAGTLLVLTLLAIAMYSVVHLIRHLLVPRAEHPKYTI